MQEMPSDSEYKKRRVLLFGPPKIATGGKFDIGHARNWRIQIDLIQTPEVRVNKAEKMVFLQVREQAGGNSYNVLYVKFLKIVWTLHICLLNWRYGKGIVRYNGFSSNGKFSDLNTEKVVFYSE